MAQCLIAVLVAGDEAARHPAVVQVLAGVVEQVRAAVEAFVHPLHDRAVVPEPDRPGEHEDVGGEDLLEDRPASRRSRRRARACPATRRSRCRGPPPARRRRSMPCSRMMCALASTRPWVLLGSGRALEGAVDEQRLEVAVVRGGGGHGGPLVGGGVGSEKVGVLLRRTAGPGRRRRRARRRPSSSWSRWSTRMPVAPQSRAYAAQSGLCRDVCQTGNPAASCSLLILPSEPVVQQQVLDRDAVLDRRQQLGAVLAEPAVAGHGEDRASRRGRPRRRARPGSRSRSSRGSPTSAPAGRPTPGSGRASRRGCRRRR